MKSNFSNQNHGFHVFRNASITFYHNNLAFDTSSSQTFVQLAGLLTHFSATDSFLWDER